MPRRGRCPPSPARSGCVCVSRTQSIWLKPFSKGTFLRGAGEMRWCRLSTTGLPSDPPMAPSPPAAAAAAEGSPGPAPAAAERSVTVAPDSSGFCRAAAAAGEDG